MVQSDHGNIMKIQIKTIQQQQKRLGYLRRGGISAHRLRSHDQGNNGKEEEQSLHVERDKETKKKKADAVLQRPPSWKCRWSCGKQFSISQP
jgi:hypothetical protein